VEAFFNTTWFVWWLLAVAAIARWYWMNLGPGTQDDHDDDRTQWKQLYRMAVQERDPRRMLGRIEVADAAILRKMNDQRDVDTTVEDKALEDARKNLAALRENADLAGRRQDSAYSKQPIPGHRGWRPVGSSKNRNNNMRRV
jgi:hypothetical protein